MLSVQDLINKRDIPDENDISLELLIAFYEEYLNKRIFLFKLDNGVTIKLLFNDVNDIFHIAGIHQIYRDSDLSHVKASEFIEDVRNGNVTLQYLRSLNVNSYKDFIPRIRSFLCIDRIIKNSEYLYYSQGIIPDTSIKVKYLLLKNASNRKLHLGIDNYKRNPNNFYAKTLLVTESDKFIDRATSQHRVNRIVIINRETGEVEEIIDRQLAYIKADEFLHDKAMKWLKIMHDVKFQDFKRYIRSTKQDLILEISKYDKYWSAKIATESIQRYLKNQARTEFDSLR